MRKAKFILCLATLIAANSLYAQMETKIKPDELPEAVTAELQKKYKKYTIVSVTKAEDSKQVVSYQINVKKKSKEYDLFYNVKGELIRASRVYTYHDSQLPNTSPTHNHDHKH